MTDDLRDGDEFEAELRDEPDDGSMSMHAHLLSDAAVKTMIAANAESFNAFVDALWDCMGDRLAEMYEKAGLPLPNGRRRAEDLSGDVSQCDLRLENEVGRQ